MKELTDQDHEPCWSTDTKNEVKAFSASVRCEVCLAQFRNIDKIHQTGKISHTLLARESVVSLGENCNSLIVFPGARCFVQHTVKAHAVVYLPEWIVYSAMETDLGWGTFLQGSRTSARFYFIDSLQDWRDGCQGGKAHSHRAKPACNGISYYLRFDIWLRMYILFCFCVQPSSFKTIKSLSLCVIVQI